MNKWISLVITIITAVAAALAVLPYPWTSAVVAGLVSGVAVLHAAYFTTQAVEKVRGNGKP